MPNVGFSYILAQFLKKINMFESGKDKKAKKMSKKIVEA